MKHTPLEESLLRTIHSQETELRNYREIMKEPRRDAFIMMGMGFLGGMTFAFLFI